MLRSAVLVSVALITGGYAMADWQSWTQLDRIGKYTLKGNVEEDKDISGLSFMGDTYGILGTDEERKVYMVELFREKEQLRVLGAVNLPASSSDEFDIEAVAQDGGFYFITGSHGVAKKSGEVQSNRFKIFRLSADPKTGLPKDRKDGIPSQEDLAVAELSALLRNDAVLSPYFKKPLQQKGINIEGLAAREGRLYVGLRNPNIEGDAFVVAFEADELFDHGIIEDYKLYRLALGSGLGIRALEWTKDCLLILAGNAGSEPSDTYTSTIDYVEGRDFELFGWNPKSETLHLIGKLPDTEGKAETMVVLDENELGVDLLIMFDGAKNGKPTVYRAR